MNTTRYCCLFFLFVMPIGLLASAPQIKIIYPAENDTIRAAAIDSNYIFGHVKPADARLYINDQPVTVYDSGGFLAFLPLNPGDFTYTCLAITDDDSFSVDRNVFFSRYCPIDADTVYMDKSSLYPDLDLELSPWDIVHVRFRGTPDCRATFTIEGLVKDAPMRSAVIPGSAYWGEAVFGQGNVFHSNDRTDLYQGSYVIQSADTAHRSLIRCQLIQPSGDTARVTMPGTLSIIDSGVPKIAESKLDLTVLRTGPRKSYYYFLPRGVKLWITGKRGRDYRVRLAETEEAWIEDYKIKFLQPGSAVPHRHIQLVRTKEMGPVSRVTVYVNERLPYRIDQSTDPNTLNIRIYGITADTDWIRYDFKDPLIRGIRWQQTDKNVYVLAISLNQKVPWGYLASYDEQNNLVIDIKKTPKIGRRKRSALKHLTILLDPGHEPDTGAVGPTGYTEREANLLLAKVLAEKLEKKGAQVLFTRTNEGIALSDRFALAMATNADILLSLHHNAVPAGVNPFKSRGSSTYYYHPQSRELARHIQKRMLEKLELPNFGLYWDNLAMCRPTRMPAVLIEPAFMMHPLEEIKIRSEKFRHLCADAILAGLVDFLLQNRE